MEALLLAEKKAHENIRLKSNQSYEAKAIVLDVDGDEIAYKWEIKAESNADQEGGDAEKIPDTITGLIENSDSEIITLTTPDKEGPYRLFVYAYDGNGHAAHANIPFFVEGGI